MSIQRALIEMRNFRINTSFGINNTFVSVSLHPFDWKLSRIKYDRGGRILLGPFDIQVMFPKRTSTPEW